MTDPHQQKQLRDKAEHSIMGQFEIDLRNMTMSEGVILVKLIDRQTGTTGYELLREMKGKFSAFMWQGVARLFGQNLKDDYDVNGEDVWIENIVALRCTLMGYHILTDAIGKRFGLHFFNVCRFQLRNKRKG
jgi:hypothetical protein